MAESEAIKKAKRVLTELDRFLKAGQKLSDTLRDVVEKAKQEDDAG